MPVSETVANVSSLTAFATRFAAVLAGRETHFPRYCRIVKSRTSILISETKRLPTSFKLLAAVFIGANEKEQATNPAN